MITYLCTTEAEMMHVYTKSAVLPESIVLELEMAARKDFNKFISTDNKGS